MTRRTIDILDKAGFFAFGLAAIMFAGLVFDGTDKDRWLYHIVIGIGLFVGLACYGAIGPIISHVPEPPAGRPAKPRPRVTQH